MTFAMLDKLLPMAMPKELQTKVIFDNVEVQTKKMPEIVVSGLDCKTGDSVVEPQLNGNHYPPILAEAPIFRKEIGVSMSIDFQDEGFVKLPRSLLTSEAWRNLTFRHKGLFLYLLEKVQYKHKIYNHHGKDISISPGQYCVTYRRLVEEYNQTLKFKKEHIDLPFLQRAVSLYDKFRWTDTTSDTGIMIITISYTELYAHFKSLSDTGSDTKTIQDRYTNEERKKERKIKETIDGANALDSSLLNNEKEEQKKGPSVFTPRPEKNQIQLSEEKQKHYDFLWKFIVENSMNDGFTTNKKPGIKERDLLNWLNVYEGKVILENLKTTLKAVPSRTWGGYMMSLFKKNVVAKKDNIQINNEFLEEIMKKHKCLHLENTKQYVTDKIKHTDYQKNSDPERFKEMIMSSLTMAHNYQEREHTQESEYDDDY